jgi:2'-5' RNA ligase|tara:strand:- start:764 stop:1258 length:495 start_codon:yes stop_codon:yes gene_type:complete
MRLFVAAHPSAGAVADIDRLPRPEAPGVRWLPADQWHVTLRFLGEADPDLAASALADLVAAPAEAVAGPSTRLLGDEVLVVPVSGLDGLAASVAAATAGVGEPPEDRPFVGHLTLCRFRHEPPSGAVGAAVSATFSVAEVVLVRSRTLHGGAVHEVLDRFPLAG